MRLISLTLLATLGCTGSAQNSASPEPTKSPTPVAPKKTQSNEVTTPSGLKYVVLRAGLDEKPVRGQKVSVHYTGRFEDGRVFDSSVLQNRPPLVVPVGMRAVIRGWDEALLDMGLGEKRRLTIPPHLAYGKKGFADIIPPNSTLVFEVELVGLLEKPAQAAGAPSTPTKPAVQSSQETGR